MDTEIVQESTSKHQILPSPLHYMALPVELFEEVIHYVALDSRPTLPALSLVCRTFREPSQRLLFLRIDLGSKKAKRGRGPHPETDQHLDNRLEGLSQDTRCLKFVKHLSVGRWWSPEENRPGWLGPAAQQDSVARSIFRMRNLVQLKLVSFPIGSILMLSISHASRRCELSLDFVDCAFLTQFPGFALPRVHKLTLSSTWHGTSRHALVQLAASPTLRTASFDDESFRRFASGSEEEIFINLETLAINCFRPSVMEPVRNLLTPNRSITELTLRPPVNISGAIGLSPSSIPHLRLVKSTAAIVAELSRFRPVHHAAVLDTVMEDSLQDLLGAIKSSTQSITTLRLRISGDLTPHTWNTVIGQVSRSLVLVETLSVSFTGPPILEANTVVEVRLSSTTTE